MSLLHKITDERGHVLGYFYGCSRGRTEPICKCCKRGTARRRCAFVSPRAGKCDVHVCEQCAALNDAGEAFCTAHRERAGLGPKPSVAAARERRERKAKRMAGPPRWIARAFRPGRCRECEASTERGARILYFPDYSIMCEGCGTTYEAEGGEVSRF
jgi:hypothetical protein